MKKVIINLIFLSLSSTSINAATCLEIENVFSGSIIAQESMDGNIEKVAVYPFLKSGTKAFLMNKLSSESSELISDMPTRANNKNPRAVYLVEKSNGQCGLRYVDQTAGNALLTGRISDDLTMSVSGTLQYGSIFNRSTKEVNETFSFLRKMN